MLSHSTAAQLIMALAMAPARAIAGSIQWQTCTDIDYNATVPLLCGNLSVPLDYTSPNSTETLILSLIKISATQAPSNESILFNFGGPGEPDRLNLAQSANELLNMTGGTHDLISFDTRGTGSTIPFICWQSDEARQIAAVANPGSGRASDTALGTQWALGQLFSDTCYAAMNQTGSLVGTAFVARDMMQIVDALDEGGLLRYWGFSYGTLLGATVSAMFPDRVDKVLLDGVVNPFEYYHGYDIEKYTDTDKVYAGFISSCVANPQYCALAVNNISAVELKATLDRLVEDLKYNPIVLESSVINSSTVKSLILSCLYSPGLWAPLSAGLQGILTKNATLLQPLVDAFGSTGDPKINEYLAGIQCSDKTARASHLADIGPYINQLYKKSPLADIQTNVFTWCAQWRMEAKERYTGDFRVKTRSPLMLIGNTYDPVTPLVSARNVSAGFDGSVVLQHNGYGHASIQQPSSCTVKHIQDFFATGILPATGTICQPDLPPFHPTS